MFAVSNPTIHESEYIIDDKRKVIVNTRDLNSFQYNLYRRNMFKRQRPDLSEYDFLIWKEKYRMGEYYLNELNRRLNLEIGRAFLMGHQAQNKENIKVILLCCISITIFLVFRRTSFTTLSTPH